MQNLYSKQIKATKRLHCSRLYQRTGEIMLFIFILKICRSQKDIQTRVGVFPTHMKTEILFRLCHFFLHLHKQKKISNSETRNSNSHLHLIHTFMS